MDVLKNSIRTDLENLLNTRLKRQASLEAFPELSVSILNYGLPDFSMVRFDVPEQRTAFAERVRWVVETYEPRLSAVVVEVLPVDNNYDRVLNLCIRAVLNVSEAAVPVVLRSRVKSHDRYFTFHDIAYG